MKIESYTGGYFQTNGYWLTTVSGQLLVDAPEGIANWLVERGAQIDAVLFTHLHYDHVVDAAAVKERFACRMFAHSRPDADLTLETVLKENIGWPWNLAAFEIDELLVGSDSVVPLAGAGQTGGNADLAWEVLHVPGHSPDSLCFMPAGEGIVFGGDVLFAGGLGRTDFPHGDGPLLLQGIEEKLLVLDDGTRVLPGHGPETTIGRERSSNPFL